MPSRLSGKTHQLSEGCLVRLQPEQREFFSNYSCSKYHPCSRGQNTHIHQVGNLCPHLTLPDHPSPVTPSTEHVHPSSSIWGLGSVISYVCANLRPPMKGQKVWNLIFLQNNLISVLCPILLSGRNLMTQPWDAPHFPPCCS